MGGVRRGLAIEHKNHYYTHKTAVNHNEILQRQTVRMCLLVKGQKRREKLEALGKLQMEKELTSNPKKTYIKSALWRPHAVLREGDSEGRNR